MAMLHSTLIGELLSTTQGRTGGSLLPLRMIPSRNFSSTILTILDKTLVDRERQRTMRRGTGEMQEMAG
jgi:hypothetical protein